MLSMVHNPSMWSRSVRGAVVIIVIVITLVTVISMRIAASHDTAAVFRVEMEKVVKCSKQKDAILCTLSSIRRMIGVGSGQDVMNALSSGLDPMQCHYVGHVVGQQLYIRKKNVEKALDQCNRECDSACIHGVIGEAFAEEVGFGDPSDPKDVDLSHMNKDELRLLGGRLCASSEACHGVGHTIFQSLKKIESSMALCRDVAPAENLAYCYNGASMEYADVLSYRNMRPVSGVTVPTKESLRSFCLLDTVDEKRSCFRYFQRIVIATLEPLGYSKPEALNEGRKICESYPRGDDRIACLYGIGAFSSYNVLLNHGTALNICDRFVSMQDKASCILGEVFVAVSDRQAKIAEYCTSIPVLPLKRICYQDLFHLLYFVGTPLDSAASLCENGNTYCEEGRKNYKIDSWEELKKL